MNLRAMITQLSPHRRAEVLIDATLDAARGEAAVAAEDASWLEAHLAGCARCRAFRVEREEVLGALARLPGVAAPAGFAARAIAAARATAPEGAARARGAGVEALVVGAAEPSGSAARAAAEVAGAKGGPGALVPWLLGGAGGPGRLAAGLACAALIAAAVVATVAQRTQSEGSAVIARSGGGVALEVPAAPHFIVRAPGLGAARARSHVTAIVQAHGGVMVEAREGLLARIPRKALLGVTQDLARAGGFKMLQADGAELAPSLETVVIRFELD